MATSKTLTPTNVTIQIPDFTDRPDQRVINNCIDKEADAINALNGKMSQDSGDKTMDNGNVHYRRKGNVVVVNIANVPATSSTDFGVLPSGYRPMYALRQLSYDGKLHLYIGTDGSVMAQAGSATAGYFVGQNVTFLTNDAFPSS